MCQAYEAERNFIVSGEHYNTIQGFAAAYRGEPKSVNPHNKYGILKYDYDRIAWDHGWDCWHVRLLPYALELKLDNGGGRVCFKASEEFKKTGKLPAGLERYL
ncbi:hypothetical protein HYT01_00680 [Candidatus Giovannonibacteria bacterium]|nr:hypothetical protein [Candidatus Giovannonibacteria bacterium]